jgi:hypothetical protein
MSGQLRPAQVMRRSLLDEATQHVAWLGRAQGAGVVSGQLRWARVRAKVRAGRSPRAIRFGEGANALLGVKFFDVRADASADSLLLLFGSILLTAGILNALRSDIRRCVNERMP